MCRDAAEASLFPWQTGLRRAYVEIPLCGSRLMTPSECQTPNRWRKCWRVPLLIVFLAAATLAARAHPADESRLRVRPFPHRLEVRLTLNIYTLTRFVKVDADGNGLIGISELDKARPELAFYLNRHLSLQINQQKASLGADMEFEYLWPEARSTPPMTEAEYSGRNVDVTFVLPVEGRLLERVWLEFDIFEQAGPMHTIQGAFEQDAEVTEVIFTASKPEYEYLTGFADDPFVQEAEKKVEVAGASSKPSSMPQAGQEDSPGHNERWWMVRVAVLAALIVLGRRATLARRASKLPTRRARRS